MKLIVAIIVPDRLEAVKAALAEVEVYRLTVMDIQGVDTPIGGGDSFRGREVGLNLSRKVQLMIGVNDNFLAPTVEAIRNASRTTPEGQPSDGKIFVIPLEDCIRIRTGEHGGEAI
ncbi:MAG TPA: transcriptional regulator [Planctomycetaceae bacterium]|nr:transcriptional regulator [Planctomycetaceae bacterium]